MPSMHLSMICTFILFRSIFRHIRRYADDILVVDENEIQDAMLDLLRYHHQLVEGAGATGVAALKRYSSLFANKRVAIVLGGAAVEYDTLRTIITAARPSPSPSPTLMCTEK